jgi:hypothetical protein
MSDSIKRFEEMTKNSDIKPNFKISLDDKPYPYKSEIVNKLEKDILDIVSKNIIQNDKFTIEDMNMITNNIKDSLIQNKYNKVYKI